MSISNCLNCGLEFEPRRSDQKNCSASCRVAYNRKHVTDKQKLDEPVTDSPISVTKNEPDSLSVTNNAASGVTDSNDPYTMPIPGDEPAERKEIIEAIRSGKSAGVLEYWPEHPEYGIIIRRTAEEARAYDRVMKKERAAALEVARQYEAKRALVTKHKGRIAANPEA